MLHICSQLLYVNDISVLNILNISFYLVKGCLDG